MSDYPRDLTAVESEALEFLLSAEFPGVVRYRPRPVGRHVSGVRLMWFGDEAARIEPNLERFVLEVHAPERAGLGPVEEER